MYEEESIEDEAGVGFGAVFCRLLVLFWGLFCAYRFWGAGGVYAYPETMTLTNTIVWFAEVPSVRIMPSR